MEKYFFDFFIWRHSRPKSERLGNTDPTTGLTSVGPDVVIFRSGALLHHERVPPVCGEEGEASQLFPQLHEGAPAQGGRQHRGKDILNYGTVCACSEVPVLWIQVYCILIHRYGLKFISGFEPFHTVQFNFLFSLFKFRRT